MNLHILNPMRFSFHGSTNSNGRKIISEVMIYKLYEQNVQINIFFYGPRGDFWLGFRILDPSPLSSFPLNNIIYHCATVATGPHSRYILLKFELEYKTCKF